MPSLGRLLITAGAVLLVAGVLVLLLGRSGLPVGRLPGDINLRGRGWMVSAPLMTSLLLSVLLSLLFWVFGRFRR
jgi:hypothetical protein